MTPPQSPETLEQRYIDRRTKPVGKGSCICDADPEIAAIWRHLDSLSTGKQEGERVTIAIDRDAAQSAYDRCKLWPEQTLEGRVALLELRKLVEKALSDDQ